MRGRGRSELANEGRGICESKASKGNRERLGGRGASSKAWARQPGMGIREGNARQGSPTWRGPLRGQRSWSSPTWQEHLRRQGKRAPSREARWPKSELKGRRARTRYGHLHEQGVQEVSDTAWAFAMAEHCSREKPGGRGASLARGMTICEGKASRSSPTGMGMCEGKASRGSPTGIGICEGKATRSSPTGIGICDGKASRSALE